MATGLALVCCGLAILYGLSSFYGIDAIRDKIFAFTASNLSKVMTQGPLLATVAGCLMVEAFLVGYEKSSLKRLLNPSKSAQSDLYLFVFRVTGILAFLDAAVTLGASEWFPMIARRLFSFDILSFVGNPWVKFAIIYLALDFAKYWSHRVGHMWKWCWEGHKLHHAATEMNMITASRAHPLDDAIGLLIVGIPAAILGSSGLAPIAFFVTLNVVLSMLHHSGIGWSWGWLGKYVICSPRYHQIHHSVHRDHVDKNYCGMLIIWDWVFGTRYDGPVEPTEFGCAENQYNREGLLHDLMEGTRRVYGELGDAVRRGCRLLSRRNRHGGNESSLVPAGPDLGVRG